MLQKCKTSGLVSVRQRSAGSEKDKISPWTLYMGATLKWVEEAGKAALDNGNLVLCF